MSIEIDKGLQRTYKYEERYACNGKGAAGKWFWSMVAAWTGGGADLMQPDNTLSGSVLRLEQAT